MNSKCSPLSSAFDFLHPLTLRGPRQEIQLQERFLTKKRESRRHGRSAPATCTRPAKDSQVLTVKVPQEGPLIVGKGLQEEEASKWRNMESFLRPSVPIECDIRARDLGNHLNEGMLPPQPVPASGRLSQFVDRWKHITNDPFIIKIRGTDFVL